MRWKKVKLTDICRPKQWKNLPISELLEDGYPVYGANGVIGRYNEFNHEFPTLAITCRGATCGTINITVPKSYITSNAMALDNISEWVDLHFLYYALIRRGFKDVITGAAQPQITREALGKIVLDIPERKEDQVLIADLLGKAEKLIAQRKESIKLIDEFLKSTFTNLFDNPVKNRKKFEIFRLKKYINFLTSGGRGWGIYYSKVGERFIRSLDVQMNYISIEEPTFVVPPDNQEANRTKVQDFDILLTITGSKIGRVAMVPSKFGIAYVSQHVAIIRTQGINPVYLSYYLSDMNCGQYLIQKSYYGQTKPGLNFRQIENFEIVVPPIELQNHFANIAGKIETLKIEYKQSLSELEKLYESLNQEVFKKELISNS